MLQDESRLPWGSPDISAPSWRSPSPVPPQLQGRDRGTPSGATKKENTPKPVAMGHLEHPGEGKGTRPPDPTLQRGQSPPRSGGPGLSQAGWEMPGPLPAAAAREV